jgi:hypothetical protein
MILEGRWIIDLFLLENWKENNPEAFSLKILHAS